MAGAEDPSPAAPARTSQVHTDDVLGPTFSDPIPGRSVSTPTVVIPFGVNVVSLGAGWRRATGAGGLCAGDGAVSEDGVNVRGYLYWSLPGVTPPTSASPTSSIFSISRRTVRRRSSGHEERCKLCDDSASRAGSPRRWRVICGWATRPAGRTRSP